MPEGDTIFRTARALTRALAARPITAFRSTYPKLTRYHDDTPLTGQHVDRVESRGKWLLIHFSGGATLATHLLMNGSWHIYRPGERWQQPSINMRIVLETADYVAVGFRVPVAEMHTAQSLARESKIPSSNVDILSANFDPVEVIRRIQMYGGEEIADVLLHQEVMAGVGNEFKSEICFVTAINPFCRVSALSLDQVQALIATSRKLVAANVLEDSAQTTVAHVGQHRRTTHSLDPAANSWVYGRAGEPCRRCAEPISRRLQGPDARVTFWCSRCQPMPGTDEF